MTVLGLGVWVRVLGLGVWVPLPNVLGLGVWVRVRRVGEGPRFRRVG